MVFPSWVKARPRDFLVLRILNALESGSVGGFSSLSRLWWVQGQHPFTIASQFQQKIPWFPPSRETPKCFRVVLCSFVRQFLTALAKCAGLAELRRLGLRQTVTGSPFPRPLPSWGCWLTAPAHITGFGVKHAVILSSPWSCPQVKAHPGLPPGLL